MAMSGEVLGAALANRVLDPSAPPELQEKIIATWVDIANVIIEHIQTQAQVNVDVVSVSGVTPGPGVSGPGVGVGTIV